MGLPLTRAAAAATESRSESAASESPATAMLPGTGFAVGNRYGVRIRTAAIRTTARAMRRGSMI